MRRRSPRWSAWLVLVSIVGNQVLFAYEPERSYWEQRRQEKAKRFTDPNGVLLARAPSMGGAGAAVLPAVEKVSPRANFLRPVSLPSELDESVRPYFFAVPLTHATIRKIHLPENRKLRGLVFHILDVHRNFEAQTNIAHTVTSLIGLPPSSAIAMVGLEGAFRPYDLSWLRSFPDPRGTRVAAEDLLAQDKMSGPMFSLLTAPTAIPPVIGIDDESHYHANLSAYRRSLASKQVNRGHVEEQIAQLQVEKVAAFNVELKVFDEIVQGYHRGTVSLGAYTRALAQRGGPPLGKPLSLFLQALEKEETLDFKKVERERAHLLESLAQKMSVSQTNELISHSMAYRAGQLGYGDFYRWIKTLCDEVDVPLTRFPAMSEYIHYVLLAETIDAEDLLSECRLREEGLFHRLTKTDVERILIARSHVLTLVEKLLDFSLTPDEWADYEQVRGRGEAGIELEPYESFYQQAHARDGAMADNFLGAIEKFSTSGTAAVPVSIIVTGGYHGPGLNEKLTQAGMAVVTVVPKIEKIDTAQGSSYLTVFAQEKTPLDKLFEGAKLFVSDAPLPQTTAALQATGAALSSLTPGDSLTPKVLDFLETHFEGVSVVWDQGIATITLTLFAKKFTVRYDPSQPMGKKIQAGQPSDPNFIQKWLQSRFVDGRLLTIGSALLVAGVWLFVAGPTTLHQMGPLVSAIGLLTILHNRTPGGRWVTQPTAAAPVPVRLDPSPIQMASPEAIGGTADKPESISYRHLTDFPPAILNGKLVIVQPSQNENGAKTIKHLVDHGARVVLLSREKLDKSFENRLQANFNRVSGEIRKGDYRWLSVADRQTIENMLPGGVTLVEDISRDKRYMDKSSAKAMAQELAGIEPGALFVLDEPVAMGETLSSIDEMRALLPGLFGPNVGKGTLPHLWGWEPNRVLLDGEVAEGSWEKLLHDPNNKGYAFVVDVENGSYRPIPRRQMPRSPDLYEDLMGFITLQNQINAGFGTKMGDGKPKQENFVAIKEDGTTVKYVVFSQDGKFKVYEGDVPLRAANDPNNVLIVVQNTKRSSRPGAGVTRVSRQEAEANPDMYKFTPNFVMAQMPLELVMDWTSTGKREYFFTLNPFPYFPNHENTPPTDDVDHVMFSRGDKHVPQSELSSIEFLSDAFEAMTALNSSDQLVGKVPFHLGLNGWYNNEGTQKAGASQNQAHGHFMRERFPVEHVPVAWLKENNKVKIGHLADPENGPGLVLEASLDNLSDLVEMAHKAIDEIQKKGDTFNLLAFPVEGGYRVIIADKVGGVPTNGWFQNEFAFAESCGRAIIADDPRKVFNFTNDQSKAFNKIDPNNKSEMVKWVVDNYPDLQVHDDLLEKARKDILSVSAPQSKIESLAQELVNSGELSLALPPVDGHKSGRSVSELVAPLIFLSVLPWQAILGVVGGLVLVGGLIVFYRAIFLSGGNVSDEKEAIDHVLGSGLSHRVTAPLLLHVATHAEYEEVARLAVRPLIAPWRNLNVDLNQAKERFTKRGWTSLAKEVPGEGELDQKWLAALAASDARHIGDVVFLSEDPFVNGNQDASLKMLNEVFPAIDPLNIETLGSPGLNQIHNIGLDLIKPEYETAFKENIRSFYSDLKVSDSEDAPPFPTVNQLLARLRKFAASEVKPGTDENKVPVQLEVYTLADIEIALETIRLLQTINEGEENPVRLLLAGVDKETVDALKTVAEGVANVVVAESPVATRKEETGTWNLETSSLNDQFESLKGSLEIGDDFALEVSLSETISVDKSTLGSQTTDKFNEALKQALLRFILNEARPFHFNTMLKIIQAIKQSA